MSSELIKQLAKNAKKKQIIELKLQEQELVKAHRVSIFFFTMKVIINYNL